MSGETSDLVAHALSRDDRNFFGDLLVDLKVESELSVVLLHNGASRALHSTGTDATHLLWGKTLEKCRPG